MTENKNCDYCGECEPCPAKIGIAQINRIYDLALSGNGSAWAEYYALPVHADACRQCGRCEKQCPREVRQEDRMREIREYFGT